MAVNQIQLCSLILREFQGEIVEKVGVYLIKKDETPLRIIAQETSLKLEQVLLLFVILILCHKNTNFRAFHVRGALGGVYSKYIMIGGFTFSGVLFIMPCQRVYHCEINLISHTVVGWLVGLLAS